MRSIARDRRVSPYRRRVEPYIGAMAHTPAWRTFKRTEDLAVLTAVLIYAGGVLYAFDHLPFDRAEVVRRTLLWPAPYLVLALGLPLLVAPLRRALAGYVWTSFKAGFGQTVPSILGGVALPLGAAALMIWQIRHATPLSPYPAGVFSGFAAGIGILAAQAVLVRRLERDPALRREIEG